MTPTRVPSLDALAADPATAAALPVAAARALLARCAVAQGVLLARLLEGSPDGPAGAPVGVEDRLLDVAEAARRLGVSRDWVYRRGRTLPFAVRLGRTLRFSAARLDQFIRARAGG